MMDFGDALVAGIPLVLVVMGLVEFSKQLGAQGRILLMVSMAIGCVLGLLYRISISMPTAFADWFGAAVYGIALGLVASKVYDAVRSASSAG